MTTIGYATLQIIPSLDGVSQAVDKQLGGTLFNAGKKGGKQLAKGVGDGLKDLEREVESAQRAYGKLKDKATDALEKITVDEKKLAKAREGGKEDQIAAAEARLNKARRDSARFSRDAADAHSELTAAQKRLSDGADDTGRRFGSLGTSMRNVGTIAGGAALAGLAALGAGAAVVGRQLYELGSDFDELSDNLQVKTGLSGAALDKLSETVTRLGTTNVPSTFAEIGDVAAEVTRNLHLTGQPLEEITSRLANLDRMGQSIDVRSLGKVFRGFGVEAEDQIPALNGLYEVSTKTGFSIDELTAALAKGGPAVRQLGLDFGESVALMSAFESAGLDGEKAQTALNKAFNYFAKEGIPAADGLQRIVSQIRALGNTPQAGELASKVFGGKGGAQFFEAIKNGDLDLQQLQSSLQLTGLDINQVSDDTADWEEKWQDLKNELAVATKPLATTIFDTVNTKLDDMSTWVTEHSDEVIDFFVDMGKGAISGAQVTLTALAGVVKTLKLFDDIVMKGFSWLPGYDDEAAKAFNDSLGDLSDTLESTAKSTMFEDLRAAFEGIGDGAKAADDPTFQWGKTADTTRGQLEDLRTEAEKPTTPWWTTTPGPGSLMTPDTNALDPSNFLPVPGAPAGGVSPDLAALFPSGGGGRGVGINLQLAPQNTGGLGALGNSLGAASSAHPTGTPRKVGSDKGLLPQTIAVKDQISTAFGNITDIGGWRANDPYPDHPSGRAIDVMIPNWSTPSGKAQGDQVAQMALRNPNVSYVLWQQRQWNSDGTSSPMEDRGSPTQNHMDHVHVYTYADAKGPHPTGTPPTVNTAGSTTTMSTTSSSSPDLNFLDTATRGAPAGAVLNNAYGAGYEPGIGTPGYDEYGKPGYFEVDPKAVREAQQRIDDQTERIRESDEAARQAQIKIDELDADADQAEMDAAVERKRKADYDAQVARRELEDLKGELTEAQKGSFSPARESRSGSSTRGSSGGSGLSLSSTFSGFGSAIGEFAGGQLGSVLDVFGVNDSPGWLQGLSQFVGGISVSDSAGNSLFDGGNMFGGGGGSAAPLSAQSFGAGVPPPDDAHGLRAGQAPGPVNNWTINARDTEDAFVKAQRFQQERSAARLSRY